MFTKLRRLTVDAYNFYSQHPDQRAIISSSIGHTCLYVTSSGKLCAIGKLLSYEELHWLATFGLNGFAVEVLATHDLWEGLSICDYPVDFLKDLQRLHDCHEHWSATGATPAGTDHFRRMMKKIHFKRYSLE